MNWESYAIIVFLNQTAINLFFYFWQARKIDKLVQFEYFSGIASRQKISSALAYLFIFKQPLFVLLYLSKPLSLAGNDVQRGKVILWYSVIVTP